MAKKVTTVTETVPDGTPGEPDPNDPLSDLQEEEITLNAIRERYGVHGATYKVYKMVKGGSPSWCFDSIDTIEEENIQQSYGGGRYAIRIFIEKRLRDTIYIDIAEPAIIASKNGGDDTAKMMIAMLQNQLASQQTLLMTILGRPSPINTPTPVGDTVALFNLMKNNQPLTNDGLITKIVERALDHMGDSGGGDWKTELIKGIKDVIPAVAPAVLMALKPNAPPQPQQSQPHQALPLPIPNPETPMELPMVQTEDDQVRQAIAMVKPKIIGGLLPAGLAIDWLLANAGDPLYQPFLKVALAKSVEDLAKIDPEINNPPFKAWFTEVLEGIKEEFKNDTKEN